MKNIKVRIAPSPTGIPHIGNTRTALFNYLFAKSAGGKFVLRIEDTDRKRLVPESEEAIREILEWLNFTIDEEYKQSDRVDIYKKHAQMLVDKKLAHEKEGAIWLLMPQDRNYTWEDLVGNKTISFPGNDQKEFVILKSDGFPTYHLASVVDDHLMEITHVIRGDEWISSTPKHIFLYECFGWEAPLFAHLPVILGPDRKKLSKRHGAESALDYRQKGYLKDALINFMALLGWNPKNDREIFPFDELQKKFRLEDINTGSPIFDISKLEWMNGEYIRFTDTAKLKELLIQYDKENEKIIEYLGVGIIEIVQTRIKTLAEFKTQTEMFIVKERKNIAPELAKRLEAVENWRKDELFPVILSYLKEQNMRFPDLYTKLFGVQRGLPLADVFEVIGKEKALRLL